MNPAARHNTIEIKVNDTEKGAAAALCKQLGIGVSTWYRGLGNAELQRHRNPASLPGESRGCRGAGRLASRASVAKGAVSGRRSW